MSERIERLSGELAEEVQAMRIAIAQRRDDCLNEDELIAMLEVYGEFGR